MKMARTNCWVGGPGLAFVTWGHPLKVWSLQLLFDGVYAAAKKAICPITGHHLIPRCVSPIPIACRIETIR
jgi:hypothetical protein